MIATATATALRVVSSDDAHLIATADRLGILWWKNEVTVTSVLTACTAVRELVRNHPKDAVILAVLDDEVPMPSEPVRNAMGQLVKEGIRGVHAVGVVGEGRIFHQTAVRSVVTGLTLVVKVPFLLKVFSTVDEACTWFSTVAPGLPARLIARDARERLFGKGVTRSRFE
jgi:hypothetical protein